MSDLLRVEVTLVYEMSDPSRKPNEVYTRTVRRDGAAP